jgi:uncharacterized protein with ATP-grasp and redox domains
MTAVLLNVIRKYQDIDAPMLEAKKRFNRLMLSVEEKVMGIVRASGDPIRRAIQFAMTGNYIDYGVIADVSEEKLMELMEESAGIAIPDRILQSFREEMASARSLLYITDNCGEIVMDKILIRLLREMYPDLEITVLVRGFDIQNDATREDAEDVGLTALVPVTGNGVKVPGTPLDGSLRVAPETEALIRAADVRISKGQGNFETLCGTGLNTFYMFLCKCDTFMDRFDMARFSGVLVNEKDLRFLSS